MSQLELANALGYKSKSTIAKIEIDRNGVSTKKLAEFAKVLNTTVEELISGSTIKLSDFKDNTSSKNHRNIAVILAGGKSSRNMQSIPNQFMVVYGKPIIIYTLEIYQNHPAIDDIYVVCLKGWESILQSYINTFGITKVRGIVKSGESGILSVKSAVDHLHNICGPNDTIIFQESTRPLVSEDDISKLLLQYKEKGSAVTCGSMKEHLQFFQNETSLKYIDRNHIIEAQSPEAYRYIDLKNIFNKANRINHNYIESCCSMFMYNLGMKPNFFEGNLINLKIIRPEDVALFTAYIRK